MKTTLLHSLAMLLLGLCTGFSSTAQTRPAHPERTEIRAYYQANVLPVVRQQRQKLDAQLSAEDKTQLATYRAQLRDLRQRGQALRQSQPPAATGAGPALTDAQRQQAQQLRTDTRAIMLRVGELAQKYAAPIAQLRQQIQPQQDKWTADIEALAAKSPTPGPAEKPAHPDWRWHPGSFSGLGHATRFLLLDPQASAAAELAAPASTVFPNPATATNQLEYTVKKAGPVLVEILDGRGTVLRTIVQSEEQEKGLHTVSVGLEELPSGPYFYKITTRAGVETKRFVKQ